MDFKVSFTDVIKESFEQYSGAVIQSRALADARDCIKPSARQILYSMYTDGFTSDKPFKKTLKAVGSTMRFYIHGDSSCEGIIMRSAQPFSMRYPLVEVEGSYGNLTESGSWAAPRYTASRLSPLACDMMERLDKYSITEWNDNYDDTEQYPRVLPSLGFYNIVNGSSGIAVGIASSIPQFNLREVNAALCKMLDDENASFDDIYCAPDFATGCTLVNAAQVKESVRLGSGKACILRADMEVKDKGRTIEITSLPYSVYANTICSEIEKLANSDKNPGIVDLLDLTGEKVRIKVSLERGADPQTVIESLYANTSLQYSYGVNMMMLDQGRYPKMFGWRDALAAYLKHSRSVYVNSYTHRLDVLRRRIKVLNALLKAIDRIDEVVATIKSAQSTTDASEKLQALLLIQEFQAKAILDIKLSRLCHLEKDKIEGERSKLLDEGKYIKGLLDDESKMTEKMKQDLRDVADKYGDERRTKLADIDIKRKATAAKAKTDKEYKVCLADNHMYLKLVPKASYRESDSNAQVVSIRSSEGINVFMGDGTVYRIKAADLKECLSADKGVPACTIISGIGSSEVAYITSAADPQDFVCVTSCGRVKRFSSSDFDGNTKNMRGMRYMKEGYDVVALLPLTPSLGLRMTTDSGYKLTIDPAQIRPQGKGGTGRKGITLHDGCSVVGARLIRTTKFQTIGARGQK